MNRILKKLTTTLAIFSLIGSAIPLSVSAVSYDPCDVNHDGSVNTLDTVVINRYLTGMSAYQNYNQFDANQNLIVDAEDSYCVLAKALGLSYNINFYSRETEKETGNGLLPSPAVPSNPTLNGSAGETSPRSYSRFSYATKKKIGSYFLTPNVESINSKSGISPRKPVGTDDRIPANGLNENTGIVHLGGGTGFIVGDHVIATVAHCVYKIGKLEDKNDDELVGGYSIETYGTNGKLTGEKLTPVEIHVSEDYISTGKFYFDYALITVKEDLSDYFHFNLGTAYETKPDKFQNIPIYVTGYAQYVKNEHNVDHDLFTDEGRVTKYDSLALCYNTDTSSGDSGAPVYTITRSKTGSRKEVDTATVLAIHSGGASQGSLITNYHLQFYRENPNIHY